MLKKLPFIRLGLNIDHVATLRNARNESDQLYLMKAVRLGLQGGADQITFHLREDRRHIRDEDVYQLKQRVTSVPLNFELAVKEDVLALAYEVKTESVTLVPEGRDEQTTESGLSASELEDPALLQAIERFNAQGTKVSLMVNPDQSEIYRAIALPIHAIEVHTGPFVRALHQGELEAQAMKLRYAQIGEQLKQSAVALHAGHGLDYISTVELIKIMENIEELNIGYFLMKEAMLIGVEKAVFKMKSLINATTYEGIKEG